MTTNHHLAISGEKMRAALPKLLAAVPGEWRGTTFKNDNLLGRRQFAENTGRAGGCRMLVNCDQSEPTALVLRPPYVPNIPARAHQIQ